MADHIIAGICCITASFTCLISSFLYCCFPSKREDRHETYDLENPPEIHIFKVLRNDNTPLLAGAELVLARVECAICLEEYLAPDIIAFLSCGHIYHENCLKIWRQQSDTCPLCQQKIVVVDISP